MAGDFAVHLGGSAFLDSDGKIIYGKPPSDNVFSAPSGFKIDAKKLEDTFKDLSGILPSDDADKKKWVEWGAPADVVNLLASVAGVAKITGTAIATYFWVVGVIMTLMEAIAGGDDQMSPTMQRAFDKLIGLAKGEAQIKLTTDVNDLLQPFKTKADAMKGLVTDLKRSGPTGPSSYPIYENMRTLLNELNEGMGKLRDKDWQTLFDPDDYKGRYFINRLLATLDTGGNLQPTPTGGTVVMFNYRIGVPAMLFAYTLYIALLRTAMPWFRTNGSYAPLLRGCAESIDRFVVQVQTQCLARTNHTGQTILQEDVFASPQIPGMEFDPQHNELGPKTYPVGAFDLANYTDGFLVDRFAEQFAAYGDTGRRGALDYTYEPPAAAVGVDAIAAAANEQAREDWTRLQVISGVFHLVKLAAEIRWATTPPMQSEVVRGRNWNDRNLLGQSPAIVSSPVIFPVGTITSSATRNVYNARANVVASTQEPGFFAPKFYRVMLRTIESRIGKEGWWSRDYFEDVWAPFYRKADGDPKNFQLDSNIRDDSHAYLWQTEIFSGHPDAEKKTRAGTATLTASTFDWYVPQASAHSPFLDVEAEARNFPAVAGAAKSRQDRLRLSGGVSMHAWNVVVGTPQPSMKIMSGDAPLATRASDLVDLDSFHLFGEVAMERAERRHVREEEVTLEYQMTWTGSDLKVSLKGNPEQRPFQVFVVIEERAYSGGGEGDTIMLHMPFTAEIVNQLYLVPEEFFTKEAEALKKGERLYHDLNEKFAKSHTVGPGDPVEGMLNRVREEAAKSMSTATIAAGLQTRLEFMRDAMPEEFEQAMAYERNQSA